MSSAPLPDAGRNWVDAHAPESLKPWLKLGRFDRPVGIWLLLLPGWQGLALALAADRRQPDLYDLWLVVGFALGACLMRAAGCAYNDIVDRDIDAKVARTAGRPIPAGRITVKQAWGFVVGCCLAAFLILLSLSPLAIALGIGSLGLVAAYPFMKRITWWPQAWLGLTFNWGALMGFAAAGGDPGLWPAALLLYAAGVFWTLGYDTIYALQDLEDDALAGVKSSARRLGAGVRRGVALFYAFSLAALAATVVIAGLAPLAWAGVAAVAAHLAWQTLRLRADDPRGALALFRANREAGILSLIALMLGAVSLF
ncbi:MAG TPA: 4-hydroxybenzoate octaprenyltransferase [Brevundimonas sp.]|jgi:4-hydroxybenzoate polyprenyltransferase|uniref:4-hydroxybenzoate octaprenyltransferase n=1 Tax=Brevundimonas sp. TaxID=1871086 RepID=UPI002E128763|nr:4-hydroxybenzoate octaprenyltransferase [Brevundimonas sp.]